MDARRVDTCFDLTERPSRTKNPIVSSFRRCHHAFGSTVTSRIRSIYRSTSHWNVVCRVLYSPTFWWKRSQFPQITTATILTEHSRRSTGHCANKYRTRYATKLLTGILKSLDRPAEVPRISKRMEIVDNNSSYHHGAARWFSL